MREGPARVRADVGAVVPRVTVGVVDEELDELAGLPARARQGDRRARCVVVLVGDDRRLGGRRPRARAKAGGCTVTEGGGGDGDEIGGEVGRKGQGIGNRAVGARDKMRRELDEARSLLAQSREELQKSQEQRAACILA